MTILIGTAGFLIAFGLAVFVHELGHFLAAKLFKVPVERFVIGFDKEAMPFMPRCIWEKKIGDTVYGLALVPLGGYVRMTGTLHPEIEKYLEGEKKEGENEERANELEAGLPAGVVPIKPEPGTGPHQFAEKEEAKETGTISRSTMTGQALLDQGALYKKPFWQKTIIYGAGVVMNLLLAMTLLAFQRVKGTWEDAPVPAVVAWQAPDSVLVANGVQQGDKIVSLNGYPVATSEDYSKAWDHIEANAKLPEDKEELAKIPVAVSLGLERNGEAFSKDFTVRFAALDDKTADDARPGAQMLQALINVCSWPAYVDSVVLDAPAYNAGIEGGDKVLSINGEPIDDWYEMINIVRGSLGTKLQIVVQRKDGEKTFEVVPWESTKETEKGIGQIGLARGNSNKEFVQQSIGQALVDSPVLIWRTTVGYVQGIRDIFGALLKGNFRKVRMELGGPVAIARMASQSANMGLDPFIRYMILLNIALAVMNILPYPVLDGGHIVLAGWEAIFRKPMPARILVPVFNWGLVTLLAFVVLVTISDVWKSLG